MHSQCGAAASTVIPEHFILGAHPVLMSLLSRSGRRVTTRVGSPGGRVLVVCRLRQLLTQASSFLFIFIWVNSTWGEPEAFLGLCRCACVTCLSAEPPCVQGWPGPCWVGAQLLAFPSFRLFSPLCPSSCSSHELQRSQLCSGDGEEGKPLL